MLADLFDINGSDLKGHMSLAALISFGSCILMVLTQRHSK